MDTPYLGSDESIILTLQDIIASGVRIEVVLTSKRLILVESGKDQVRHEDILFETIGSVMAGENAFHEPTITLSINPPSGDIKTVDLIFFRRPGIEKRWERDQLVAKLKERISPSLVQAPQTIMSPSVQVTGAQPGARLTTEPGDLSVAKPANHPPAQEWTPRYSAYNARSPPPPDPQVRLKFNAITAIIIIIVAVVGGALIYSQFLKGKPSEPLGPATNLSVTSKAPSGPGPTPTPVIQQVPVPEVTLLPSPPPQLLIPQSGVWVRITYPGTFIGVVGSKGGLKEVNTSGDQFYQIPARDGIVDVEVQKQEGSGDELAVAVYKDGSLVKRSTTTKPKGTVDLHVTL